MGLYMVTGGAGFIGSHIVKQLVKQGEKVRVVDNLSTGNKDNLGSIIKEIEFIEADIRDKAAMEKSVEGADYVLHQAALRSVPRSVDDPFSTNEVNVSGTLNLLLVSAQAKVKRFVYASSSSVYGDSENLPKREEQKPSPVSPYAVSKLSGEYYCRVFTRLFGLETVSLRYFNVFGPRQDPQSKYAAVIPLFILSALEGKPLEVHGDGQQSRDFTYISNVVEANLLSARIPNVAGKVFNIACGEKYSLLEVVEAISKGLGVKLEKLHTAPRAGDVRHTLADISEAKKLLGYQPKTTFHEGMKKTIEYFKENYLLPPP